MTLLISPQIRVAHGQSLSREALDRITEPLRLSRGVGGVVVELSAKVLPMRGRFEGTPLKCRAVPPEVLNSPNTTWVHLTTRGTWRGHPNVEEFTFGDETFGQIIANFNRTKTPVAFKYEHPVQMGGEPIPSAGKVYDLSANEAGLWGLTEFTDEAAGFIRKKAYEYCSVIVRFDARDRVTNEPIGAELLQVGLTDDPFIDGQQKITLPPLAQAA